MALLEDAVRQLVALGFRLVDPRSVHLPRMPARDQGDPDERRPETLRGEIPQRCLQTRLTPLAAGRLGRCLMGAAVEQQAMPLFSPE
jgi:hypothetical protein